MRARSWMAALALIGGTAIALGRGLSAQGPSPSPSPSQRPGAAKDQRDSPPRRSETPGEKPSDTHYPAVQLNLVIAGLGRQGCDVQVKPANAGCKFRVAPSQHVTPDGRAKLELRDVELRGADHTCTVAITVFEPGQAPRTIYRGFRMAARASAPPTIPSFTCYFSSRLAGVDADRPTRK